MSDGCQTIVVNVKNDYQMCAPRDKLDLNAPFPLVKLPNNFHGTFPSDFLDFFFYTVLKNGQYHSRWVM